jgi:uncharacterized protein with PIN domain
LKFVADTMLGKLSKWLRVLGHDTHYQGFYKPGALHVWVKDGGRLLTRQEKIASRYDQSLLIRSVGVKDQLLELRERLDLVPERSAWFTRCIVCNEPLQGVSPGEARDNVPEYIFYLNMNQIRRCPSCGRYYWPGSHRQRMIKHLLEWGVIDACL